MVSYLILVRQTTDTRKTHPVTESIQNCVRCAVHLQHFYTQHLAIATDGSHPGRLRARALEAPRFACAHVMWAYVCSVADGRHGTAAIVRSSIPARLVCGWHSVHSIHGSDGNCPSISLHRPIPYKMHGWDARTGQWAPMHVVYFTTRICMYKPIRGAVKCKHTYTKIKCIQPTPTGDILAVFIGRIYALWLSAVERRRRLISINACPLFVRCSALFPIELCMLSNWFGELELATVALQL